MAQLLGVGRSKGASILLGLQDISGLRAIYSTDRTDEILGHCVNKTFLRLGNPASAEWASKYFGDREAEETKTSQTTGKDNSGTHAKDIVSRSLFLPSEFLNLEVPGPDPQLSLTQGIHHVPDVGDPFFTEERAQAIFAMNRKPTADQLMAFPNEKDRPIHDQKLAPWSPSEELDLLGPDTGAAPKGPPPPRPPTPPTTPPTPKGPAPRPNLPTSSTTAAPSQNTPNPGATGAPQPGQTPSPATPKPRPDLTDLLRRRHNP